MSPRKRQKRPFLAYPLDPHLCWSFTDSGCSVTCEAELPEVTTQGAALGKKLPSVEAVRMRQLALSQPDLSTLIGIASKGAQAVLGKFR